MFSASAIVCFIKGTCLLILANSTLKQLNLFFWIERYLQNKIDLSHSSLIWIWRLMWRRWGLHNLFCFCFMRWFSCLCIKRKTQNTLFIIIYLISISHQYLTCLLPDCTATSLPHCTLPLLYNTLLAIITLKIFTKQVGRAEIPHYAAAVRIACTVMTVS